MFPNYRRTAAQRRDRMAEFTVLGVIVVAAAFWGTMLYVIWHFVEKFW